MPAPAKPAEVYDFRRPSTLAREHSRVLELAFETFARQWGTQLTAKVRVGSQVTCEQVLMHTYDEYAASLPATTAMVTCTIESTGSRAVIQFPTSAALTWVGHMLGAGAAVTSPERKFSPVEQALIRRMMDDALDDLRYSLGALLPAAIAVEGIQYNSQFAQAAATTELMIVAKFTVRVGDVTAPATVALPAPTLLPQLGETNPTASVTGARRLVEHQVSQAPVDIAVQFAPATVMPAGILRLAIGDVIPIPHPRHRPLDVTVDGHRMATAAAGVAGSRLACVVVTTEENQ